MKSNLHYLHVYPLPSQLSQQQRTELLRKFGAEDVRHVSIRGKQLAALAGFKSASDCRYAISRLHQMDLLDSRLRAQLHKQPVEQCLSEEKQMDSAVTKLQQFEAQLTAISSRLGLNNALPHHLKYKYPAISPIILANITNAIAAVPKLYVQVLHLMNKMNLPPPFGELIALTDSVKEALALSQLFSPVEEQKTSVAETNEKMPAEEDFVCRACKKKVIPGEDGSVCSSESELESDQDTPVDKDKNPQVKRKKGSYSKMVANGQKRARLQLQQNKLLLSSQDSTHKPIDVEEAFSSEIANSTPSTKLKLNIPPVISICTDSEVPSTHSPHISDQLEEDSHETSHQMPETEKRQSGFGKLDAVKTDSQTAVPAKYISLAELEDNRVKETEFPVVPVLANYSAGEASCRLYIKNLARNTTVLHLHFIFDRFAAPFFEGKEDPVDLSADSEKYSIRVMQQGRMKGQAFVTLPTPQVAEEARALTNGYILNDKPMVVAFARAKATS